MGFWGLEVKPGKPQTYHPKNEQGKLHLTQATLGSGLGKEKSVIQCSISGSTPIYLCSLLPNKSESCPLNLEFEDDDETVEFSVTGDRSIHLSGFFEAYDEEEEEEEDEDDSDAMDVAEMESGESSDYDSEDDEDQLDQFETFLDRNLEMYRQASAPNSGVVIEEIEDEEKPVEEKKTKLSKKKSKASKDESEDEDGFLIVKENNSGEKMSSDVDEQGSNKKRKAKASEQDGGQESAKKKKNQKEKKKGESASNEKAETGSVPKKKETTQTSSNQKAQKGTVNMSESSKTPDKSAEKKNKQKNSSEKATVENSKASQEQTYPNGLVVEDLKLGKPNGKKATPGKQVSVRYIGKLQKNGKIFDSNIGKAPFKFRLGGGQVIKGWDVGVNGMRVGDKRKLTIPPSMGYGSRGAGGQIPPNAWLSFDVELIDVK